MQQRSGTTRTDRLVALVASGSSATVKNTAARQLGQLAASAAAATTLGAAGTDEAGTAFFALLSRLVGLLRQEQWDARVAAGLALEGVARSLPARGRPASSSTPTGQAEMEAKGKASAPPADQDLLSFATLDLDRVLARGRPLLASLGVEFDVPADLTDPKARLALMRKNLKQQLGIGTEFIEDFLDVDEADLRHQPSPTPAPQARTLEDIQELAGLSARERNKRKRQAKAAAQDPRKHMALEGSRTHPAPAKGGGEGPQEPLPGSDLQLAMLTVSEEEWLCEGAVELLSLDLFDPRWHVRHGAAIGLRALLQHQGHAVATQTTLSARENRRRQAAALEDLAVRCICVLALDRFVDFVSDAAIVPVREMAGQVLGCIASHGSLDLAQDILTHGLHKLSRRGLQSVNAGETPTSSPAPGDWSTTFSALIGLKYLLAARKADLATHYGALLPPARMALVFDCLAHPNDDIRRAAAQSILHVVGHLDLPTLVELLPRLWTCFQDRDELSSWTVPVMELLSAVMARLCAVSPEQALPTFRVTEAQWRLLFPLLRHPLLTVRLQAVDSLARRHALPASAGGRPASPHRSSSLATGREDGLPLDEECRLLALQNMLLDTAPEVVQASATWFAAIPVPTASVLVLPFLRRALALLMHPLGTRFPEGAFDAALLSSLDRAMVEQDAVVLTEEVRLHGRLVAAHALGSAYLAPLGTRAALPADLPGLLEPYSYSWVCQICCLCFLLAPVANVPLPPGSFPPLLEQMPEVQLFFCELLVPLTRAYQECAALSKDPAARGWTLPPFPSVQGGAAGQSDQGSPFSIDAARQLLEQMQAREPAPPVAALIRAIADYDAIALVCQTRARAACAYLVLQGEAWPDKQTALIRALMNSLRTEGNAQLQQPSAQALARLCTRNAGKRGMVDKIFGNLLRTLDVSVPVATCMEGIPYRGVDGFLRALCALNGATILDIFSQFQAHMDQVRAVAGDPGSRVMALQLLHAALPHLDTSCLAGQVELLPVVYGLACSDATTYSPWMAAWMAALARRPPARQATLLLLVDRLFEDLKHLDRWRLGIAQVLAAVVRALGMVDVLPYLALFTLPLLPRMSDPDAEVRTLCTELFSHLVALIPLEAGLPDPEDMHPRLAQLRRERSKFLGQLVGSVPIDPVPITLPIRATLRPYQVEGVSWLLWLNSYGLHGLLADDMGLGKTLSSICVLACQHRPDPTAPGRPVPGMPPSLVICPSTLVAHWIHEIRQYADFLRPAALVDRASRGRILAAQGRYDVLVTSYDVARNECELLAGHSFHYCILDEGHLIKGRKSKITQAVKRIRAQHRLILTGTPIQNNVLELWSLFDFLMPGYLGREQQFADAYSRAIMASREKNAKLQEQGNLALEALHRQTLPFILRRCKEDVLHDLPPKIIQDYFCELSPLQRRLLAAYTKHHASLAEDKEHIFKTLQYLRKLINHPALVFHPGHAEYAEITAELRAAGELETLSSDIQHAPKLLALRQLLQDILPRGDGEPGKDDAGELDGAGAGSRTAYQPHRVLLFSQTTEMLDRVEAGVLAPLSITSLRLDGTVEASRRHGIVTTFNADPSIDVLLLTTSVGGLGLNLTGADTVIFLDHDWNPMKDLQAMDRAHRLGQRRVVQVYRLITKDTLEEKIMGLQKFKLHIASSVVNVDNTGILSMNTGAILDLLQEEVGGRSGHPGAVAGGQQNEDKQLTLGKMLEELEQRAAAGEGEVEEDLGIQAFLDNL